MNYRWRDGNSVRLLINGEEFYAAAFAAIHAASKEVLLETFITARRIFRGNMLRH